MKYNLILNNKEETQRKLKLLSTNIQNDFFDDFSFDKNWRVICIDESFIIKKDFNLFSFNYVNDSVFFSKLNFEDNKVFVEIKLKVFSILVLYFSISILLFLILRGIFNNSIFDMIPGIFIIIVLFNLRKERSKFIVSLNEFIKSLSINS